RTANHSPTCTVRSRTRKAIPELARIPPRIPPNTDVMPARYTVDSNARPPIAVNETGVTTVCRYANRQPPIPAMNDEMAKLEILTPVPSTPMPAAERSLARTASIAEPRALARSHATPSATATSVTRQSKPKLKRGNAAPVPTARFSPNSFGATTDAPADDTNWPFRNHSASMAYASARVTTPNVRPRTRSAGSPTTTPTTVAMSAARIGARGNGTPQPVVSPDNENALTPANASCARETWPAYPVTT